MTTTTETRKEVTLPDTEGNLHDFAITYVDRRINPGWHVVGDDLDAFVPFGSLAFPTATSVVVKAYQIDAARSDGAA